MVCSLEATCSKSESIRCLNFSITFSSNYRWSITPLGISLISYLTVFNISPSCTTVAYITSFPSFLTDSTIVYSSLSSSFRSALPSLGGDIECAYCLFNTYAKFIIYGTCISMSFITLICSSYDGFLLNFIIGFECFSSLTSLLINWLNSFFIFLFCAFNCCTYLLCSYSRFSAFWLSSFSALFFFSNSSICSAFPLIFAFRSSTFIVNSSIFFSNAYIFSSTISSFSLIFCDIKVIYVRDFDWSFEAPVFRPGIDGRC